MLRSFCLLQLAVWLPFSGSCVSADVITISNSDFSGGVYDLTYFSTTNKAFLNGVEMPFSSLVMTNTGLAGPTHEGSGAYWHANGYFSATQLSGDITMGWDLSGVTHGIQQVELLTNAALFQFSPWTAHAFEDKLFGEIGTPTAFGTTTGSRYFEFEGNSNSDTRTNFGLLQDVTSHLSGSWLADPNLLELRLGYQQHAIDGLHPNIPGKHLQVFRNVAGGSEGFRLRLTAASSAAVPEPSAILGLLTLLSGLFLKRRLRRQQHLSA